MIKLEMPGIGVDCNDDLETCRLPIFTFADDSYPSNKVEESQALRDAIENYLMRADIPEGVEFNQTVREFFAANPDAESHWFPMAGVVPKQRFTGEGDLDTSYGGCRFVFISSSAQVIREENFLRLGNVQVYGYVYDEYDFDWNTTGYFVKQACDIQACYEPVCGREVEGRVFGHYTILNTVVDDVEYEF